MKSTLLLTIGAALLFSAAASAAPMSTGEPLTAGEQVVDLPLGAGMIQRVLLDVPNHPHAVFVMLPGGTGNVGVEADGDLRHDDNFVVRTRAAWVARGYAVLIPDTVDDANLRGRRSAPAYGQLVDSLATYARTATHAPVFLLGTSQGTIAAVNGAAQARPGLIAGLVLTESVSVPGRRSTETVFDADPAGVRVPALVVANRDDACDVAPPAMAPRIAAAMVRSPSARVLDVRGGIQQSERACGSLSPHGYDGIEEQVIGDIVAWVRAHGG